MFGWTGKRDSAATAAPETAKPPPPHRLDATDGFPRGLPDGDRHKPAASARWPSSAEVAAVLPEWRPGMILLGRDHMGRYYGHDDDRHVLTVAGSRAGKGVSLIVPNLLYWPGSCIVIDPKGELATLTASRRSAGGSAYAAPLTPGRGEVYALDPFGRVTGDARQFALAGFNPMAEIDIGRPACYDLCAQLADALVIQADGDGAYWTQSARALITALIFSVVAFKPPAEKNLITVRRIITKGADHLRALCGDFAETKHEVLSSFGQATAAMDSKELKSILSAAGRVPG